MNENKDIPTSWEYLKLGELCEVITGTTPPKNDLSNYGKDIPFVKPPHLQDKLIEDMDEKLSIRGAQRARVVPSNTVLVTCIGNLGRTGLTRVKSAFNQQLNAILENEFIIGKYIFYQAQSSKFRTQLEDLSSATTVSIVNKSKFSTIEIPLPPLPEQHRIVAKIEELFSSLDKGIESLKTAQQQLKVYRQAVLKWAFEGKLTKSTLRQAQGTVMPVVEPVETTFPKEDSLPKGDALSLPKGWKKVNLGELCEVKDGTHDTPKYIENGIPFITQKNIKESGLTFNNVQCITDDDHEKYYRRSNVTYGDILISMIGANRGMCCIVNDKRIFSIKNVGLIKENDNNIFSFYLLYFLKSINAKNYVKSLSKGGAQEFIGLTELRKFPILLAPIPEQKAIVAEIESRLSVCDKIEETIEQSLQQSESLRQSILKKAFAGKLVPQDPNDEPASQLLERIRAGKEALKKKK